MKRDDIIACMQAIGARRWKEGKHWIDFPCPFAPWTHKGGTDSDPSFGVKKSDGPSGCRCQSCGVRGPFVGIPARLAAHFEASDPNRERLLQLAGQFEQMEQAVGMVFLGGIEAMEEEDAVEQPLDEDIWGSFYDPLTSSPEALHYLAVGRLEEYARSNPGKPIPPAIPPELMASLGVQFDPEEGRIMFPCRDLQGVLWGFAGRSTRGAKIKVRNTRGFKKENHILGQHLWKPGLPTIMVEGLFAYARLHALGLANVGNIGAIMGSSPSETQISQCGRWLHLWLDNDTAGIKGIHGSPDHPDSALKMCRKWGVTPVVPRWPQGKTDPDELTYEESVEMLEANEIGALPTFNGL